MNSAFKKFQIDLSGRLSALEDSGLYKFEQAISSPQQSLVTLDTGARKINLCANNYLGLSNHPKIVDSAKQALDQYGYGMSSVRFICGTQVPHKSLEAKLSTFLGKEDTILFPSCFDANTGLFEALLGPEDAVISDALNHASIIDGVRLCKATRYRYSNSNMADLKRCLEEAKNARHRLIATDGVFSMDGHIANLPDICELAGEFDAMVMVDDSHAVGFVGKNGRGTPEYWDVEDHVDILTGTLGKALGGASGGYVSAGGEAVDWLRQRARPYLFSNTVAPAIANASLTALNLVQSKPQLRKALWRNTELFRSALGNLGFELLPGEHPIVPVMLRDPILALAFANELRKLDIFVAAFSYPVVPEKQDRIRTQMSAAHKPEEILVAIEAFAEVGRKLGVIS